MQLHSHSCNDLRKHQSHALQDRPSGEHSPEPVCSQQFITLWEHKHSSPKQKEDRLYVPQTFPATTWSVIAQASDPPGG